MVWNSSAICACVSHSVSFSNQHGTRVRQRAGHESFGIRVAPQQRGTFQILAIQQVQFLDQPGLCFLEHGAVDALALRGELAKVVTAAPDKDRIVTAGTGTPSWVRPGLGGEKRSRAAPLSACLVLPDRK